MQMNRALQIALVIVVVLVLINVLRHFQTDPVERERLNPEQRPRLENP